MEYKNFLCPYELASKLHELGVDSESEFYFVKEIVESKINIGPIIQKSLRYVYSSKTLIPAYMIHELGEIMPNLINIDKSEICDDWLQLTQYFPNADCVHYVAAYVRYNAYDSPSDVYTGFGDTEVESRAMLLIDLLEKKVLTLDDLNLNKE